MTDDTDGVITVEIFGQQYPIRSQLDASYVAELARYVDEKMQSAADRPSAGDSVRVAVLAALNIADEYFRCRDGRGTADSDVQKRAIELEALVAHLLVRCGDDGLRTDTTKAFMGRLAGPRLVATANTGPDRLMQVDFDGADLTRFPPGMQTALQALAELGTEVDAPRATSGLWLLQPDGRTDVGTASHPTVEVRVAALGEC